MKKRRNFFGVNESEFAVLCVFLMATRECNFLLIFDFDDGKNDQRRRRQIHPRN